MTRGYPITLTGPEERRVEVVLLSIGWSGLPVNMPNQTLLPRFRVSKESIMNIKLSVWVLLIGP